MDDAVELGGGLLERTWQFNSSGIGRCRKIQSDASRNCLPALSSRHQPLEPMNRCVCIHGHFYQPPRENPWLEAVELQDSAQPFHDWNERIVAECYGPNAHARLLDDEGRIRQIVSNYARISFNFGPTLLSWIKDKAPDIHQAIVDADKESRERYGGHGSALAQCYNHVIMPLANQRDQRTQVIWGLRDFEYRFGRKAEGMWLPECAADNASLDALASMGIRFTILSPSGQPGPAPARRSMARC